MRQINYRAHRGAEGAMWVGMRDASEVVCLDTEAELCKSVAEAFRQGRTSVEVGERLFIWGAAVPGNTEEQMRSNPIASAALMLLACEPRSPDQIVDELQEVARGPLMYPASVCDSVPFHLAVGLDAVPEITEEQVAKVIAEKIRRREAEQTQLMSLMSERAQSNPMIFRLNRSIREAWEEPPRVKPRSKRGQRVRRWR